VPSYLGFKTRANKRAAQSNLREAIPTAEAFYSDAGTYVGLNHAAMVAIDSGLQKSVSVAAAPEVPANFTPARGGTCGTVAM